MSRKNTISRTRRFKEMSEKKQAQLESVADEIGGIEWYLDKHHRRNRNRHRRCGTWIKKGCNLPTDDKTLRGLVEEYHKLESMARKPGSKRHPSFRSVSFFEKMGVYDPEPYLGGDEQCSYHELMEDGMNSGLNIEQADVYATACLDPNVLKCILSSRS